MSSRPPVPKPVKRVLRQEAGFGCCRCGLPIYDYHHIVPYTADDPHFRVKDMMLLCPNHHREATLGGMSETEQRRFKADPYNRRRGVVDGALRVFQPALAVTLGSVHFVGDGTLIEVDDDSLLRLHMGPERTIEFSLSLYSRDDELLALIERNEWIVGDPLPWDLEVGPRRMTVRERSGLVSLTVDTRTFPISIQGHLWRKGQHFHISPDRLLCNGVLRDVGFGGLAFAGLKLRADTSTQSFVLAAESPSLGGSISGGGLEQGIKAWQRMVHPVWPWSN